MKKFNEYIKKFDLELKNTVRLNSLSWIEIYAQRETGLIFRILFVLREEFGHDPIFWNPLTTDTLRND